MRTIRRNVFETNSSSEHSLCIDTNFSDSQLRGSKYFKDRIAAEKSAVKEHFDKNTGKYVLSRFPGLHFGKQDTFERKIHYVLYLLVVSGPHANERNPDHHLLEYRNNYEDDSFTGESANVILHTYYKDLVDRLAKYISDTFGVKCTDVAFPTSSKKQVYCNDELDHQVRWDSDFVQGEDGEVRFGGMTLFDIITTENVCIDYQFC